MGSKGRFTEEMVEAAVGPKADGLSCVPWG
jgi:hypothetical protein